MKRFTLRLLLALVLTAFLAVAIGVAVGAADDDYAASVGSTKYTTLDEALANAGSTTVTVLKDTTFSPVSVTGTLKVDLAGHRVTVTGNAFTMGTGSTLYLWSSAKGGSVTTSGALVSFAEATNATPANVYLGAYAGSTTATTSYRDNLTVKCQSIAVASGSENVNSQVNVDGGTYVKTSSASNPNTLGYGMFHASKHQMTVTVKNATIRFDTTSGSLLSYTQAGRGALSATFDTCDITAPANNSLYLSSSYSNVNLGTSSTFNSTVIDGLPFTVYYSPAAITIGNGCKINTPTDLSGLTSTAKSYTSEDGTTYTMKFAGSYSFVSSRSGYEYCISQTGKSFAPKVSFKNAAGDADLEVANWLRGEIPEFRGVPETKIIDGLVCTYGYPDVTRMTAHASFTFTPTLVDFGTPFLGRLSIDSNIRFTVYVPVKAGEAGDLAVNGAALELPATMYIKGNLYYPFEIAVTPSDALRPLMFTYTIGGENFKTPISVFDYLEKILALDTTTVAEKRIAYALVSYIGETAAKFNASDDYTLGMKACIDSVLRFRSQYALSYVLNLPVGEVTATANIKGAAFDLGAEAALVVYLSPSYIGDLAVSYYDGNGEKRALTVPYSAFAATTVDGTDYLAAEVFLPVADYLCDLTLTAGTGSVKYSLPVYMANIAAENGGEVPPYTLAFYYYTKAAYLYRQTEIMSIAAMEEARTTMGPKANPNPAGTSQFNPASALLTLALQVHHRGEADAYCNRLVELLGLYVDGAGNEPCADLGPFWTPAQICLGMGIAKQTPVVWDRVDDATKEKLDFFMSVFACIQSFGTDDNNNYTTGPSGNGNYNKGWNPNYRMGNVFPMIGATLYFGSADAVNQILAAFDYDTYIAKMTEYNFTNMLSYWTGTGDKARAAMNNSSTKTTAYLKDGKTASGTGYGVLRKGYTYHYLGHGLDDLAGIFSEVMSFTYSATVTSDSSKLSGGCYTQAEYDSKGGIDHGYPIVVGAPKAFIVDGTKSPVEGMLGMISEFNGGDAGGIRSSAAYCDHDFIMAVGAMAAMVEMGLWSPEGDRTLYEKVWVGNTDLIYKLEHGYHSYSKGQYDSVDREQSYGGYYMMKSLWCDWLAGYHAE